QKLRFLYANGSEATLRDLVAYACKYDPARATNDFLRLLNTNFDSPSIYWALGTLFKELWQLETACMWFEQILIHQNEDKNQLARAYLELADCYVWRNYNLSKAIEYARLAHDLTNVRDDRATTILSHALLKA